MNGVIGMDRDLVYRGEVIDYESNNFDWRRSEQIWQQNFAEIQRINQLARERGTIVGRIISESVADGQAHYQIIKENKNSVRIRHCKGFPDDYMVSYWGEEATIDKQYALRHIRFDDYWHNHR